MGEGEAGSGTENLSSNHDSAVYEAVLDSEDSTETGESKGALSGWREMKGILISDTLSSVVADRRVGLAET